MSQSKKEMMNRALSAMTINIGKRIVKLKFAKNIARDKDTYIAEIVEKTRCKLIDVRGHVAVIYKKKP